MEVAELTHFPEHVIKVSPKLWVISNCAFQRSGTAVSVSSAPAPFSRMFASLHQAHIFFYCDGKILKHQIMHLHNMVFDSNLGLNAGSISDAISVSSSLLALSWQKLKVLWRRSPGSTAQQARQSGS